MTAFNFREKVMMVLVALVVLIELVARIIAAGQDDRLGKQILADIVETRKLQAKGEADYKAEFLNKCLLARQVYQFSWYRVETTRVGPANLRKQYAMSLQEYNDLIELSWRLNRFLALPLDGPENYMMIAKWIMESAICNQVKHRTGEIIRMTGYTRDGLAIALYHYKYTLRIGPGHPLYIKELYDSTPDIERIFSKIENVVKFDYAYIAYLLRQYEYRWDFVLTAFHFGEGKTEYWVGSGLKEVPNYRLDGKWKGYWLRQYYQSVFEIAQGISMGQLQRISRWSAVVDVVKTYNEVNQAYLGTLVVQAQKAERFAELEKEYKALQVRFENYKKTHEELCQKIAELNDVTLDYRRARAELLKRELRLKLAKLKASVQKLYRRLVEGGKPE